MVDLLPDNAALQETLEPCTGAELGIVSDNALGLLLLLLLGLAFVEKSYCLAETLDEIELEQDTFLTGRNSLTAFDSKTIRLLITSRPEQYLQIGPRNSLSA